MARPSSLFTTLLPQNDIQRVRYFTARVEARPSDPTLPVRQDTYLRALATLPKVHVHLGTFLSSTVRAPVVQVGPDGLPIKGADGRPVVKTAPSGKPIMEHVYKTEEKGSDVNLAAHLLRDAYRGDCQCAVVVSNDSDLLTPVRMVRDDCNLPVGLITPRKHGSMQLRQLATFQRAIRVHNLLASQFPPTLADAAGTITKPPGW